MSRSLEQTLADLARIGTLIKDRGYRQVWRFLHDGKPYYLKFYPKAGPRDRFRRFFRGSPALAEFTRLQALQRAQILAPRAVAVMVGFSINHRRGDAVILEAIEPSVQLDHYIAGFVAQGKPLPDHHALVRQVIELVHQLQHAGLGHEDLHPGNFLLKEGKLFLLDGYAVRTSGMRQRDLLMLAHSLRGIATTSDLLLGWLALGDGLPFPRQNPLSDFLWKRFLGNITKNNRYFGRLRAEQGWRGVYYKRTKSPRRFSVASGLEIAPADWERAWPQLLDQMNADQLPVLKRSRGGDVLSAQITLAGQALNVIVKRPRRRYWYRYFNEIGRGSRPRRAWRKAWNLLVRGLPTAWPLLLMEQRRGGYVTDAVMICERVPGPTLAHIDLSTLADSDRQRLLHRTGRILRQIESFGFSHFDAKASNWIVFSDQRRGPTPVLIDIDGIRRRRWPALGIRRLLRSMAVENPSYTATDSLLLCRGYAPRASLGSGGTPRKRGR